MSEQDEQFDPSEFFDQPQGGADKDTSEAEEGGEQGPQGTSPGMGSGDIKEAQEGGGPDELPEEDQALSGGSQEEEVSTEEGGGEDPGEPQAIVPEEEGAPISSHTIENHLGEEIVISSEALNYIEHLQNQLEAEKEEVERLNTQVQRLNRSTSIGRR